MIGTETGKGRRSGSIMCCRNGLTHRSGAHRKGYTLEPLEWSGDEQRVQPLGKEPVRQEMTGIVFDESRVDQ